MDFRIRSQKLLKERWIFWIRHYERREGRWQKRIVKDLFRN